VISNSQGFRFGLDFIAIRQLADTPRQDAEASREHPSSFHYAVASREMFTYKKVIPNKKGMSLYIDYKYNKIIDIVMQTEIERNKGR